MPPHYLDELILMRDYNVCFDGELSNIIPKLSPLIYETPAALMKVSMKGLTVCFYGEIWKKYPWNILKPHQLKLWYLYFFFLQHNINTTTKQQTGVTCNSVHIQTNTICRIRLEQQRSVHGINYTLIIFFVHQTIIQAIFDAKGLTPSLNPAQLCKILC